MRSPKGDEKKRVKRLKPWVVQPLDTSDMKIKIKKKYNGTVNKICRKSESGVPEANQKQWFEKKCSTVSTVAVK